MKMNKHYNNIFNRLLNSIKPRHINNRYDEKRTHISTLPLHVFRQICLESTQSSRFGYDQAPNTFQLYLQEIDLDCTVNVNKE